jgi:heme/copper-type cytochrome/quinol oxidase subunit 2
MKRLDTLSLGDFRFLEVDNRLLVPVGVPVRFIITSVDVIHSWALPSFFLKLDAIAGLLSVFRTSFNYIGHFYGQCRELCGTNHSFMPIVLEVTLFSEFISWLVLF